MFWEHGYPTRLVGRRPQSEANVHARENPDLVVQTGYYAMRFDGDDLDITGLDLVDGGDYLGALHDDPVVVSSASLAVTALVDQVAYTCRSGAIQDTSDTYVRLVEAGRYLQRFEHVNVVCEDAGGRRLSAPIRVEVSARPDRFVVLVDADRSEEVTATRIDFISDVAGGHTADSPGRLVALAVPVGGAVLSPGAHAGDYVPAATRVSDNRVLDSRIDAATGAVVVDILPQGPGYPDFSNRHDLDEFQFDVSNPHDEAVNLPLVFNKVPPTAITGSAMTLVDHDSRAPTGIAVQIAKNWHGTSTSEVHRGSWIRGSTMIRLEPGETRRLVLRSVDGYWGATPAASHSQLSLVGYEGNWKWDELALGAWGESMALDPTLHLAGSFVADFRPAFTLPMNGSSDHNWTENTGGADFLVYFDAGNTYRWLKRVKTAYLWTGPNLTRVLYSGVTDDDRIRATYEFRVGSTFDYLRAFHRFRYEFLDDVVDPGRLTYFQMAADYYMVSNFPEYHIGGAGGLEGTFPIEAGGNEYKGAPHPFDGRWLSVDDNEVTAGDGTTDVNRAIVLRELTLNGADFPAWLHRYGRTGAAAPCCSNSAPTACGARMRPATWSRARSNSCSRPRTSRHTGATTASSGSDSGTSRRRGSPSTTNSVSTA
ncbi:MAG: hypothetical protein M5U09_24465 [Gammaproteobacteria bacterium]|nr:hypothetical protein [Gammaproteobacteria bacterium]